MKTREWLSWRGGQKIEDGQRRGLGLPEATSPWTQRVAQMTESADSVAAAADLVESFARLKRVG